eukprot:654731-Lingulodinium_polyedra.AAC.1
MLSAAAAACNSSRRTLGPWALRRQRAHQAVSADLQHRATVERDRGAPWGVTVLGEAARARVPGSAAW